jgi:3-oxoacyl-[acyl-carrier-protein] synthase II
VLLKPAAITGVGAVTPLGVGAGVLHERWRSGVCGIEDGRGACDDFDPTGAMSRKEVRRTHRNTQMAAVAADEAVEQAWGGDMPYEPERVACFLGVAFGGSDVICEQHKVYEQGGADAVWTLTVPLAMANASPAALAIRYGLRGESNCVGSACAAAAQAIGEGLKSIRLGESDACVVGGAEAALTPYFQAGFAAAGALSRSGISRPFDRNRDGFVMGEGAGILVLEDPDRARERGAEILGYLAGFASTTDAHHMTAPDENGGMCAHAIRRSLADAGVEPHDVSWVNAHGTSTQTNDRAETGALKAALGDHAYRIPVSAPKSVLGHSIGAAGGVEAVATVMALRDGMAPPTVGLEEPDEGLDLDYVPGSAAPIQAQNGSGKLVAISNSFAFGGHNATLTITT